MRLAKALLVSLILMASFTPSVYGLTAFTDGFEAAGAAWDDLWDGNGATTWTQGQAGEGEAGHTPHGGSNDAWCSSTGTTLTSDDINLLGASSASLTFWYYLDDTEAADLNFYLYDGATYDLIAAIGGGTESTWLQYSIPSLDSQYLISNFRIRFDGTGCASGENVMVDDVLAEYTTGPEEYSRTASQSVTWGSSVAKSFEAVRAATQSLGWGGVASALLELGRSASQGITWGGAAARILGYERAATQGLIWGGITARSLEYVRAAAQNLSWESTIARGIELTRLATQNVVYVSESSRLLEATRSAAQSLVTSWEAERGMAGTYNALADLILYIKTNDDPTPSGGTETSSSGLFIVVIVFLSMAMAFFNDKR